MTKLLENEHLPYFAEKGVPSHVLLGNYPTEYENSLIRINVEIDGKLHAYSPEQQKLSIGKLFNYKKPYLAVIAGQYHDEIPSQVALFTCVKSIEEDLQKTSFFWHHVTGARGDRLRDDDTYRSTVANSRLLVLSGMTANCSYTKIEKVRDLLVEFSHIPRIVIVSGTDPVSFCFKQLFVRPTIIGYFGGKQKDTEK